MHIICTANTSAAILQHGIYCSSIAVWQRPIADPLAIYFTLTIFVGYIIITLNAASTCWRLLLSLVFLLQCYYLSALLRQCSICCNIFYSIWRSFHARRLCFLLGSTILVYASWCYRQQFYGDILLAQLSGLLFCFCFMLQRTNHSEPFASLVL